MKNIRIGNIELRTSGYNIKNNIIGEIVLWYVNRYYGREKDFFWSNDGEYAMNATSLCKIHKSCFEHPESCYVVAFVESDGDADPYIISVGARLVNLDDNNLKDFIQVCRKFYYNWRKNKEE